MADPTGFDPARYTQPGVPNWYDPNLYAPQLAPQIPALANALQRGLPMVAPAPVSSGNVADAAPAVGSGGNGAMGMSPLTSGVSNAGNTTPGALSGLLGAEGMSGVGRSDGYTGQVQTIGDFLSALGFGAGLISNPMMAIPSLGLTAVTGKPTSPLGFLAQKLGLTSSASPRGVVGDVVNSIAGGPLGDKNSEVSSSAGDQGPQGGEPGHEGRGLARGGSLSSYVGTTRGRR